VYVQCVDVSRAASEWSRQTAGAGGRAADSEATADVVGSYARGGGHGYFFVPDDAVAPEDAGDADERTPLHPPPPPTYGIVHILAANVAAPADIGALLRHELTHAVDQLVHGVDLRLAGMLACSELRASMLGECADGWNLPLSRHGCGRRHATRSMALIYGPETAAASVRIVAPLCLEHGGASPRAGGGTWLPARTPAPSLRDRSGFARIQGAIDKQAGEERAAAHAAPVRRAHAPGGAPSPLQ
jgi:hypothetical protein